MARGGKQTVASPDEPVGDGGAREEEVSQAQAEFDSLSEQIDLGDDAALIVKNAVDWVIELFKHRPKPWGELSQIEQRDLVSGVHQNVKELVRHVVEAVATTGKEPVRCLFVGFTDKGDDIKAELKLKAYSKEEAEAAVVQMHRARGKIVLVTVASADDFDVGGAADRSEPDQRPLEFEAGGDEVDLEEAAEEVATGMVRTGDTINDEGKVGEYRVNLKEGVIQFLPAGGADDHNWEDVREATPAELAAERERAADFGVDEEEPVQPVEA